MKSFRDLNIYLKAHQLAIGIHHISLELPKHELYEEGSQIRRFSKAVSTAIVEGYSRKKYKADFIKFLVYVQAECDETIEHLDFLFETGSFTDKIRYQDFTEQYTASNKSIGLLSG